MINYKFDVNVSCINKEHLVIPEINYIDSINNRDTNTFYEDRCIDFNNYFTNIIDNKSVDNINDVLDDIKLSKNKKIENGISILLRIKNEELTIEKCILSIQKYVDEIIIVNNLSTDGTYEIIKKLEEKI